MLYINTCLLETDLGEWKEVGVSVLEEKVFGKELGNVDTTMWMMNCKVFSYCYLDIKYSHAFLILMHVRN